MTNTPKRITKLKKVFPFLILLLCHHPISATGIHFEKGSFSSLLKKAEKEHKMIFLECCTSWCPPCRRMEKNVFPNDTVGDFYNSHFICATIDAQKGEGITLAKRYEVGCYPTYLFIDEKGNLVHRQSSECSVADFIAIGNAALTPELQFATIDRKCKSGKTTPAEILADLKIRKETYVSIDSMLDMYMRMQPDTCLSNKENWALVHAYTPAPWNHMFRYLLNHQQEFIEKYTKDTVETFVERVYGLTMSMQTTMYGVPDTAGYRKLREEVVNLHLSYSDDFLSFYDMDYYILTGNPNAFGKTACAFLRNYCDSTSEMTGWVVWKFTVQDGVDTAYLDTAIFWAARAVRLTPNYHTTADYSRLLFKRGRKQEAETQALNAIQFAEKDGVDAAEEKELLRKIRAMN